MRYAFIRDHLVPDYPVRLCCRALGVSPSGYYHARVRPCSARRRRRLELAEQVRSVHEQTRRVYGSPRLCPELRRRGVGVCRNTTARLMREAGLRSRRCRRFRPRTTDSSKTLAPAPNLLRHAPPPDRPGSVWVAEITYIPLAGGFVYLAAVMDLCSRCIVGWALDDRLYVTLTERALRVAVTDATTAHDEIFRYIEGFYNRQRLHSSLDYRRPDHIHHMQT